MARSDPTASRSDLEAALIEALFTQSPVGLHLLNTDLHVVRFNTATALTRSVPSRTSSEARSRRHTGSSNPTRSKPLSAGSSRAASPRSIASCGSVHEPPLSVSTASRSRSFAFRTTGGARPGRGGGRHHRTCTGAPTPDPPCRGARQRRPHPRRRGYLPRTRGLRGAGLRGNRCGGGGRLGDARRGTPSRGGAGRHKDNPSRQVRLSFLG